MPAKHSMSTFAAIGSVWAAAVSVPPLQDLVDPPIPGRVVEGHRIVFEVTEGEPSKWDGVLGNVENARAALGPGSTDVVIVAHSKGLGMLLTSNARWAARMRSLASVGVEFSACHNTMEREGVTSADLLPFVNVVDSGVAEVVRRQDSGWAYIRP